MTRIVNIYLALLLALWLMPAILSAYDIRDAIIAIHGRTQITLGYATIGSTAVETLSTSRSRSVEVTVPAGGLANPHMYTYGKDSNETADVTFSIFDSDGDLYMGCSNTYALPPAVDWVGGPIDTTSVIPPGVYTIQVTADDDWWYRYDDIGGTGSKFDTEACGTAATEASTRTPTLILTNYAAH